MSETKYYVQDVTIDDVIAVPSVRSFTAGLAVGVNHFQRIGRNVRAKNIGFKLWWNGQGQGAQWANCRVLVVYPRKAVDDQSALTAINILTYNSRPDPTVLITLYDKCFPLGVDSANTMLPKAKFMKWNKRVRYQFNYDGNNEVRREPLLVFLSNLAGADASDVRIRGYMSMSFKDI